MLSIQIEKAAKLKPLPPDESQLGFGTIFTDYTALADWSRERGWHHGRIVPFGPLPLHPASMAPARIMLASPSISFSVASRVAGT